MKDKVFIDTNVLLYLYSDDLKSEKAKIIINREFEKIVLSTQVLNELINVLVYKLKSKKKEEVKEIVTDLVNSFEISIITNNMIISAIDISIMYQYRFFDSLMITSALEKECKILYSEDMQNNQLIENTLKIINPFKK